MNKKTTGGLIMAAGLVLLLYGAGPALGLSGVGTTPCPTTVWFFPVSTTGVIGTTPIGSAVTLQGGAQAAAIWNVSPLAYQGLSATYNSRGAPVVPYVPFTTATPTQNADGTWNGMVSSWGTIGGYFYSSQLGEYNSDGSCSSPGGFYMGYVNTSATTVVGTSSVNSATSTTATVTSDTITSTGTSTTVVTSVTATTVHNSNGGQMTSSSPTFILAGLALIAVGGYTFTKKKAA